MRLPAGRQGRGILYKKFYIVFISYISNMVKYKYNVAKFETT